MRSALGARPWTFRDRRGSIQCYQHTSRQKMANQSNELVGAGPASAREEVRGRIGIGTGGRGGAADLCRRVASEHLRRSLASCAARDLITENNSISEPISRRFRGTRTSTSPAEVLPCPSNGEVGAWLQARWGIPAGAGDHFHRSGRVVLIHQCLFYHRHGVSRSPPHRRVSSRAKPEAHASRVRFPQPRLPSIGRCTGSTSK